MNAFTYPLTEYSEVQKLCEHIEKGQLPVRVTGCTDSQKPHLIAAAGAQLPFKLILAANELRAKEIYNDYRLFDRNVVFYPPKDIIFYSADVRSSAITAERLSCLKRLAAGEAVTVVTAFTAGMDKLIPIGSLARDTIHIDSDSKIDTVSLAEKLTAIGYENAVQVEVPGQYSIRGGIIDVYPLAAEAPYRIELWGDDIDSIRMFDPSSQRSVDDAEKVDIFPASEVILTKEQIASGLAKIEKEAKKTSDKLRDALQTEVAARIRRTVAEFKENLEYIQSGVGLDSYIDYFADETVSLFDYFDGERSLIVVDEPARVMEEAEAVEAEFLESMKGRLETGYILPGQLDAAFSVRKLTDRLSELPVVLLSTMEYRFTDIPVMHSLGLNVRSVSSYNGDFEMLVRELSTWKKSGYRVILLTSSRSRAQRLAQDLSDRELNAFFSEDDLRNVQPREIKVASGSISRGFEYPLLKFAVISESDIFGQTKTKRRHHKMYEGTRIPDFTQLETGDYVVHENYGVGVYRGIEKIEVDHVVKDYIKVEYAGKSALYVPASSMDVLMRYSGPEGKAPKLNKLDTNEWRTTKSKVRSAVKEIAGELVSLYALRQAKQGYRYGADTVWQREFEELFPFEETEDQLKAIEDTKHDMESGVIMDRLICGDVGYGKTEVAIRAAFKAVQDGKQVAFLVPTTILAQQHYNTFKQRMMDYPVSIEMLSRFRTPAEQKKTLMRLKSGQLDIVIGTHRLLSKDVSFKDLGLLIVDEEQRFGVTHKEKIKQLKSDVDVLTLTATPIPRTMHMSLVGIRDMSVLNEAPVDRLPIQTFVLEHNDEIIREAIGRELARGGQVYYVFNRVQGISDVAGHIQRLLPEANVVYAHGQMSEHQLEAVMLDFVNGDIDVLVSTTIIETGLDISNVNTIIIDDADRFGLSQLYQLRGRVGRSNRTAYAFLMYKRDRQLKETAEKRLEAIREFTELGSGIKIAMRDLEIRGAGNLLGAEQSGHMSAVGYDMYCKLLNEAVKTIKLGEEEVETWDTFIDLEADAFIPATYIRNEALRLEAYKRISNISNRELLVDMQEELTDRYGDIPQAVDNLLNIALLKSRAHDIYITSLTQKQFEVKMVLYGKAKIDIGRLPELMAAFDRRLKLVPDSKAPFFEFRLDKNRKKPEDVFEQLHEVLAAIEGIRLD